MPSRGETVNQCESANIVHWLTDWLRRESLYIQPASLYYVNDSDSDAGQFHLFCNLDSGGARWPCLTRPQPSPALFTKIVHQVFLSSELSLARWEQTEGPDGDHLSQESGEEWPALSYLLCTCPHSADKTMSVWWNSHHHHHHHHQDCPTP